MILQQSVLDYLDRRTNDARQEINRIAFASELIADLIPHFPHSLDQHFVIESIWVGYGPPECGNYTLRLQTKENLAEDDVSNAFGSIIKVAAALLRLGWKVDPQPEITAASMGHALDVEIKATRDLLIFRVSFLHLPESERCKLVKEDITIPAHTETKLRVVCEGEPVRLVEEPAPPLAEVPLVLQGEEITND